MTPEERCYKVLQESNFVRIPEEDPAQLLPYFLEAISGCSWEYPVDAIQEKQFETNVKTCFSQFHGELFQFAKNTESTIDGMKKPFNDGYRGMDDQGFEGVIIKDGSFYRNIQDEIEYIFFGVTDAELESKWQAQATIIQTSLMKGYDKTLTKEESDAFQDKAKEAQNKQELVQKEITRRHK